LRVGNLDFCLRKEDGIAIAYVYHHQRMMTMKSIDTISFSAHDTYSSEEYFQRMLILERSRSKKTGKPVVLILLDIGKLTKGKRAEKAFVLRRLVSLLNSSTQEIDVEGWYMLDSIIGIICKDVEEKRRNQVTGRLNNKLNKKGIFHLVGNKTDTIKLLCYLYPDS
jgi:hypothetical protein